MKAMKDMRRGWGKSSKNEKYKHEKPVNLQYVR
jgi:hypothetical protein